MSRKSPFPPYSLNDALIIAQTILEKNSGQPMRRITLFNVLGRQPDSGPSRSLVTASAGYGLTQGSYTAEQLTLTARGRSIVEHNDPKSKLDAVLQPEVFRAFFERYRDAIVPAKPAALDFLKSQGVQDSSLESCYNVIISSGKQAGLISEFSGKERIITPKHALELVSYVPESDQNAETINHQEEESINEQKSSRPDVASQKSDQNGTIPSVHIDIQIHIPPDASTDQIDQIFASMAKHLYGRG